MPRRSVRAALFAAALLAAPVLAPAPAVAQFNPADPGATQSVYVRDSAIAADKFELAKRMERLKEWHKSADVYQEILEKYQDRVVLTRSDAKGRPLGYQSVTVAVQERLARWPEEGLAVYRTRFEPQAATLLNQARRDKLELLHRIFDLYFVTDSAREAGIRLMEYALETGDFHEASWIGDRLLAWHPNLALDRPGILFRTSIAYHLGGNAPAARKRFEELRAGHPDVLASIGGQDVRMVDALEKELQAQPPLAHGASSGSYRTFGGDETRNLAGNVAVSPGTRVYKIDLPEPDLGNVAEAQKRSILAQVESARKSGQSTQIIPAVDQGELYFQDGENVWGVYLESGMPLSGWLQTYPERGGRYKLDGTRTAAAVNVALVAAQFAAPVQHSITLTDDAVVAVMGRPALRLGAAVDGGTRLVCLDRATGKPRWSANPNDLPNNPGNAKNLSFSGSPLVVGDNVYVMARGSGGAGAEDCHVLCFSLETGAHKWSCYVASSQTGAVGMGMPTSNLATADVSHMAFASGRIYVLTNLGAIAAIDAYSGATAWLTLYPRGIDATAVRRRPVVVGGMATLQNRTKPWEHNPVIVKDGKVFALPGDGEFLHIYDAGSGQEGKRIPLSFQVGFTSHEVDMLLAVIDNVLIVGTTDHLLLLDWEKAALKPNSRKLVDEAVICPATTSKIMGRPFVTRRQAIIPTDEAMMIFDMERKRIVDRYPRFVDGSGGKWPADEYPGNIVVSTDHVIVANARNVSVYTDLEGIRQKYQVAIRDNPSNIEARLVFSELMFNAHEIGDSVKALDEAVAVLGGREAMRSGPARDRVFADALLFARRLAAENDARQAQIVEHLYGLADAASATPSQRVSYRLSRARFLESRPAQPDSAQAVRLYQEILLDRQMRLVTLAADEKGILTQAGRLAEDAIEAILRNKGRDAFAPFEAEAAEKLKNLAKADELLALAQDYPNAVPVAIQAMLRAARTFEDAGQPRQAAQVLRQLNWKYATRFSSEERLLAVEALARNLLKVDNIGAAFGRVQRLSAAQPDAKLAGPLVRPDGNPLAGGDGQPVKTFKEAAAVLASLHRQRSVQPLPEIKLPPLLTLEERKAKKPWPKPFVAAAGDAIVPEVQAIVLPRFDRGGRTDRIVGWGAGKLMCFAAGRREPLWNVPLAESPLSLHWLDDKRLLVWGGAEIALLDAGNGTRMWRVDLSTLPAVELLPGGAESDAAADVAVGPGDPNVQVMLDGNGPVLINRGVVRLGGGVAAVAVANIPDQPQAPGDGRERVQDVRVVTDQIVITTGNGRVIAAALPDGKVLWQARLANGPAIQQMDASDDFVAVRMMQGARVQLLVLDCFTGQQIFRKSFLTSQNNWAVNIALADDGTLVWTTPQAMVAKDLYEPGDQPTWEQAGRSYAAMSQPEQLVIADDRVLAVCDNGLFVDRRRLRTGEVIGPPLSSAAKDASARLRMDGDRLYIVSNGSLASHHLAEGTSVATYANEDFTNEGIVSIPQCLMLSRGYTFLPGAAEKSTTPNTYVLRAYTRTLLKDENGRLVESGRQEYRWEFSEASPVKAWQAVDGGIYYLTEQDNLCFLKATGQ